MKIKLSKASWELCSCCGISFDGPRSDVNIAKNKVGKTKTSSKIRFDSTLIQTGVSAEIPEGLELVVVPNSDLFHKYGVIPATSCLIYTGTVEELTMPVIAMKSTSISAGTPIATIKVKLSNDASIWTKIKYIFTRIEIDEPSTDKI